MGSELLIGVDVGTTETKVAAFDLTGKLLALTRRGYNLILHEDTNAAEQAPADWWTATVEALRELTSAIDASPALALCVGGQGPTVVALDKGMQPVGNALTWMDLRATAEARLLSDRLGRQVPSFFFVPKVLWLKNNCPHLHAETSWYLQSWDFVTYHLTDQLSGSTAEGVKPWSDELLQAADLDSDKFVPLVEMGSQVGLVTAEAAEATGLKAGLPVVGGIVDFFESLIGTGTVRKGLARDRGGTSQGINLCWDRPLPGAGVMAISSFMKGLWYIGGPISTTGKALQWFRDNLLGSDEDYSSLVQRAAKVPVGSEKLIFLPYLAGERSPIWDPAARGVFFGLSLSHRADHFARAVLESVAYAIRDVVDRIEEAGGHIEELRVCGGQARSQTWNQIKADVTGKVVVVPEVTEAEVLGAAIIAGKGVGVFDHFVEGTEQMVRIRGTLPPDGDRHQVYSELFALYRDLYLELRPLFQRLSQLSL
ncbi:MAG: FGGY-family carbohydrate kinase [Anaerolineae bacterium]